MAWPSATIHLLLSNPSTCRVPPCVYSGRCRGGCTLRTCGRSAWTALTMHLARTDNGRRLGYSVERPPAGRSPTIGFSFSTVSTSTMRTTPSTVSAQAERGRKMASANMRAKAIMREGISCPAMRLPTLTKASILGFDADAPRATFLAHQPLNELVKRRVIRCAAHACGLRTALCAQSSHDTRTLLRSFIMCCNVKSR